MARITRADPPRTRLALSLAAALAAVGLCLIAAPPASAKARHQDCDAEAAEERGCQYTPAHPETGGKSHTNAGARRANAAPPAASGAGSKPAGKPAPAAAVPASAATARPAK